MPEPGAFRQNGGMSTPKTAAVTGAGSGVGQAVALRLARDGWRVALLGRRRETLQETIRLAGDAGSRISSFPCNIGDAEAVSRVGAAILQQLGSVEVLVNAAGTNVPRRSLEVLSPGDYREIIDTNLNGAYYITQAFLPGMRARKSGTIVHVVSDAGKAASPNFPGDIDTPLLDKRPSPPPAEARTRMLRAEDVAACVLLAITLPSHAVVEELILRPR